MALTDFVGAGTDRLSRVLRALGSGRTYRDALQAGAEALLADTDVMLVQVWTFDETTGRLDLTSTTEGRNRLGPYWSARRLRRPPVQRATWRDLASRVIARGEPVIVDEAEAGTASSGAGEPAPRGASSPRSGEVRLAGLPLTVAGDKVGVLTLLSPHPFCEEEMRLLRPVADAFAITVAGGLPGRERLLRMLAELEVAKHELDQEVADLTLLADLFERLCLVGELEPLLDETLAVLCGVLGAERGLLFLAGPGGALSVGTSRGLDREAMAMLEALPSRDLLAYTAMAEGRRMSRHDVFRDRGATDGYRALATRTGVASVQAVPLIARAGETIGCVVMAFAQPHELTRREERLVEASAQYAAQLIAKAQVHAREHDVAQTLQRSMLLPRLPVVPGTELAARYRPGTVGMQAGGDWYDALVLPDDTLGLMIGDVVGHGVHAASIMGQLRSALRAYALIEWEEPAGVLDYLDHFVRSTGVGEMTTATFLTVDPATLRVRLANSGHYPPLLLSEEGASYLEAGLNIPLGVSVNVETTDIELPLEPGCLLLLYTDGLVERRGESIDDGLARLREATLSGPDNLEELCDHLLRECAPAGGSADDIAMLAVRLLG